MPWQVLGHERAVTLFEHALAQDHVGHAYLLSGPRGIGKRTLAIEIGKALACQAAATEMRPCQECESCLRVVRGAHPDVRLVELAQDRTQISRRDISALQSDAALRPLLGLRKIYLLINAERLSDVAANQMLKLLEEPPPAVVLVLTAEDASGLLPTIVSRCQHVRLHPLSRDELANALVAKYHVNRERAEEIAAASDGQPGWALRAVEDPAVLDQRVQTVTRLSEVVSLGRLDRLLASQELASRWPTDRDGVRDLLRLWTSVWRDVAFVSSGVEGLARNRAAIDSVRALARDVSSETAILAARRTDETAELLDQNVNPRLALDLLFLDLPSVA